MIQINQKRLQDKNINEDSLKTETIDQAIPNEKPVLDTSVTSERVLCPRLDSLGLFEELNSKVKSMMSQSDTFTPDGKKKALICRVCGKEGYHTQIKNHIEFNHLGGISLPCTFCEKTFKTRDGLRRHIILIHNEKVCIKPSQ